MNIGVAEVLQSEAKLNKWLKVVLVQPRLSIIFISSKESCCSGWCGGSHTLPYSGYATMYMYTLKRLGQGSLGMPMSPHMLNPHYRMNAYCWVVQSSQACRANQHLSHAIVVTGYCHCIQTWWFYFCKL